MKILSHAPEDTFDLAKRLAAAMEEGTVLCLKGDLGAGKTLFAQGLAAGLRVADDVTSPTFSLLNIYEGVLTLYHFDLYRLDAAEELEDIGFYEYTSAGGAVLIEWPDKFAAAMPEERIDLEIARGIGENERTLSFSLHGTSLQNVYEEMKKIAGSSD